MENFNSWNLSRLKEKHFIMACSSSVKRRIWELSEWADCFASTFHKSSDFECVLLACRN
jgi:hypothetical protein